MASLPMSQGPGPARLQAWRLTGSARREGAAGIKPVGYTRAAEHQQQEGTVASGNGRPIHYVLGPSLPAGLLRWVNIFSRSSVTVLLLRKQHMHDVFQDLLDHSMHRVLQKMYIVGYKAAARQSGSSNTGKDACMNKARTQTGAVWYSGQHGPRKTT